MLLWLVIYASPSCLLVLAEAQWDAAFSTSLSGIKILYRPISICVVDKFFILINDITDPRGASTKHGVPLSFGRV